MLEEQRTKSRQKNKDFLHLLIVFGLEGRIDYETDLLFCEAEDGQNIGQKRKASAHDHQHTHQPKPDKQSAA